MSEENSNKNNGDNTCLAGKYTCAVKRRRKVVLRTVRMMKLEAQTSIFFQLYFQCPL